MKVIIALAFLFSVSAQALTVTCKAVDKSVILTIHADRPQSTDEWQLAVDGKTKRNGRISVNEGPRHRRGIDGYSVEFRKGASPLSARTVYEFWTRDCVDEGGEVQISTGAGTGNNKPAGNPITCTCQE